MLEFGHQTSRSYLPGHWKRSMELREAAVSARYECFCGFQNDD